MFARLLGLRRQDIVAGFIIRAPRAERLCARVRRSFRYDGWRAAPRMARHAIRQILKTGPRNSEALFRLHGVPIYRFGNPNAPECVSALKKLTPDIILNNQPWIIKSEVLAIPKIASLNRHTGALPDYRGLEPVFYALLDGAQRIGVVVHSMTTDIDAGDVVAERFVAASKSVFDCYDRAFAVSAELYDEAINMAVERRTLRTIDAARSPYYTRPNGEAVRSFRASNLRYL